MDTKEKILVLLQVRLVINPRITDLSKNFDQARNAISNTKI